MSVHRPDGVYSIADGPARFKLRTDRFTDEANPRENLILACRVCGWSRRVRREFMGVVWEGHVASKRHARRLT